MFLGLDLWQLVVSVLLILLLANYIAIVVKDRLSSHEIGLEEGFSDDVTNGWLDDPFDAFYAKVYNKIFNECVTVVVHDNFHSGARVDDLT